MAGFKDGNEAMAVLETTFEHLDREKTEKLDMTYAYRFTDLDWSCTLVLKADDFRFVEGEAQEAETTIETTSEVFDKVMRGEMNVVYAHLSNQARTKGSLGNVLKLRSAAAEVSKAYRVALSKMFAEASEEPEEASPGEEGGQASDG